ncbi:hypothetical protein OIDMADRAFT_181787 [Oidiodendron maius Zn]|uniref:Uncharacterized protein n=1 Tax=Oidiodendron maius (strain Zn) TaxID=913774 RepID=A0A0C3CHA4_OIDMZ|nr:hypothetical protein OIDMADRAFT_181787 [Oidiodendron maius Zn]
MDPLSITASVIAVVQLTATVGSGFRRLLAVRGATDQLLQLMNEVTDFDALIHDIYRIVEDHKNVPLDSAALSSLPKQCERAMKKLEELDALIQRCIREYPTSKGDPCQKLKKVAWLRTVDRMKSIQTEIRELRMQMSTTLASLLSIDMLHVRLILRDFSLLRSPPNQVDIARLTEVVNRFESLDGVAEQLQEVLTLLKPCPPGNTPSRIVPIAPDDPTEAESLVTRHISSAANPGTHLVSDSQTIRLTFTTYSTSKMVRPCTCNCHNPRTFQSFKLIQKAIGQLFMGYSGQLSHFRECKKCPCIKANDARVNFTYYFPAWFLARAFEIVFRSSELAGPNLTLRTYRVVPDESLLFHFARSGMIQEIQLLFADKLASPLDISSKTGRSALHFAADYGQEEVCNFLIKYGSDVYFEDKYFMSPFDIVWEKTVEQRPKTAAAAFGFTTQTYDVDLLMKRGLFPLHRVVLGISEVDIAAQLEASWPEINMPDFWGRTPLSWAAGRGDIATVKILLEWKADVTIADKGGWASLHHAARAEDPSCIEALLLAGAPMDARNTRGNTPLAVACSYRDSPEHILPFLRLGADVTSAMKDGYTPLAICVKLNHTMCAKVLIQYGASLDGIENRIAFPIHVAAAYNSHEALTWLLNITRNHSFLDCNGWSLLHHAASSGDITTLKILKLEHLGSLNPDLKTRDGQTPWEIFNKVRPENLNEEPETYQESLMAFEALIASLELYHDSTGSSPLSTLDEWHDALENRELGDSGREAKLNFGDSFQIMSC